MMPEQPARLDVLDRLKVPDLWKEVTGRHVGTPPPGAPSPLRKAGIVVLALLVAALSFLLVLRLRPAAGHRPATSPSPSAKITSRNGLIYFHSQVRSGVGVPTAWEAISPGGSGLRTIFPASGSFVPDHMAFSLNGNRIAANLVGLPGIWLADINGGHPIQLTHGANDAWPTWSPDGTKIAFAGSTASKPCPPRSFEYGCHRDLYVVNADGTGLHLVATNAIAPSWSPDGGRIAYGTNETNVGTSIQVVNADGTRAHFVAGTPQGSDTAPAWSPDGTTIVYSSIRNEDWGIYAVPAAGGAERPLVPAGSRGYVDDPVWSPDGKLIAFVASDGIDVMRPDGTHIGTLLHRRLQSPGVLAIAWRSLPRQSSEALSYRCFTSTSRGEFDGDGLPDVATLNINASSRASCGQGPVRAELSVSFGSGDSFRRTFPDCSSTACSLLGGSDFLGSGRDELVVALGPGTVISEASVYFLDHHGWTRATVAPPGDPGTGIEPGPILLGGNNDSGLGTRFACRLSPGGGPELVQWIAEAIATRNGPVDVHESVLRLSGTTFSVVSNRAFQTTDERFRPPLPGPTLCP